MKKLICATLSLFASASLAQDVSPRPLMRDFMGINAHTVQFRPELYAPLCRLVRDYHPIDWDLNDDSSNETTFPLARKRINWKDRSGVFRDFSGQPNWKEIYGAWQTQGFVVNACLTLGNFTYDKWANPAEDAYRYGRSVAQYFGPSGQEKLVESVEIGNEPAGRNRFSDDDYMEIFRNMAKGIREGDPKLTILTCTVLAPPPDGWSKSLDLFKGHEDLYDVINVHQYAALKPWPTFERSFPEDERLKLLEDIQRTIKWRDTHAPGKGIWLTEFGYDASSKPAPATGNFRQWKGVTDEQQAQWIVRSFLVFAGMDLDRAYLYWFNDHDVPGMHSAAGVTRHYEPKKSYWAMRHLYQTLGDHRLERIERSDDVYVYAFVHGERPAERVWVAWLPSGEGATQEIELALPGKPVRAEAMPLADGEAAAVPLKNADGKTRVEVGESPVYIHVTAP